MIFGRVQTQTDDRRVHFWTNEHNQWQLIREVWYVKENKNDVCGCLKDSTLRAIITNKGENRFIFTLKNRIQPRTLRDVNVTSAGFLLGLVSEPVHSCETERSPEVLNREILTAQLQTRRRTFKAEYLSSKRISEEFFFGFFCIFSFSRENVSLQKQTVSCCSWSQRPSLHTAAGFPLCGFRLILDSWVTDSLLCP